MVVSELARGINAEAHTGALESKIVPGGLDIIYAKKNTELYQALKDRDALISWIAHGTCSQATCL